MDSEETLARYRTKRHFHRSTEPTGGQQGASVTPIFVVQHHHSSTHHYDFRLEIDGVLKSWAVPKGPSLNPANKRLAIPTEDHPLQYASFEGIIPPGEYGAGTVLLWDSGIYSNLKEIDGVPLAMAEAYRRGHLVFELKGKKLKGSFGLIRTGKDGDKRWLLIKKTDSKAIDYDVLTTNPLSVISGKTMEQIEKESAAIG